MPLKLPSVLGSVRIPRYFAHDFLQRTRYAHAFTASWPSLFVAAPHTKSSLHVDQWSGNFWMAMVKGTKRWTLFHKDDVAFCAPDYSRGTLDPAFPRLHEMDEARAREKTKTREGESDVSGEGHPGNTSPFFGAFPFLPYARRWDVDLGPGEVLFVPGGFPHVVHNLDVTVSFAGNYVDESNLDEALRDMALLGAKYGDAMRASHAAIDEVWFDENDEVWVEERLDAEAAGGAVRGLPRGGGGVLGRGGLAGRRERGGQSFDGGVGRRDRRRALCVRRDEREGCEIQRRGFERARETLV
jgi:solute carrier family 25 thiamine pyrophosphate transporter 19